MIAAVALLVAAAFFLPEMLMAWGDSQSLDILQMESQDEEREGFAESIQLSVAEKIMLLHSGALTAMELDRMQVEGIQFLKPGEAGSAATFYTESGGELQVPPDLQASALEEADYYIEEVSRLWNGRLASAGAEIRALQAVGGLPELWKADILPDYSGRSDLLFLDPATYISFQVYQLALDWGDYRLDLLVDVQSERILSFTLQWTQGSQPNWGPRGASSFGSAWRDYWKMDSVSAGWYNDRTRGVLENMENQVIANGDYAAYEQITFLYDSQNLAIPLECQGGRARNCALIWNR